MSRLGAILLTALLVFSTQAQALYTELGLSYNYMKRTFSEIDNIENQSSTFSMSFYIWERVALELSYTNGLYVKKERESKLNSTAQRITTQFSDIYESNLIYVFADRKSRFQPYIKGGAAYIKKRQVVQIDTDFIEVNPKPGWAPSYGAGLKMMLTESLGVKGSWEAVRTPLDDTTSVDDVTGRVGVTWMF